eukprot:scaffold221630_cov30-Tisochrysis_lutea.AAC.2
MRVFGRVSFASSNRCSGRGSCGRGGRAQSLDREEDMGDSLLHRRHHVGEGERGAGAGGDSALLGRPTTRWG